MGIGIDETNTGIHRLSSVSDQKKSEIALPYSGTGLIPAWLFFSFDSSTGLTECRSFRHSDIYKFHAAQLIRRDRENYLTYNIIVVLKEFNYLLAVLKIHSTNIIVTASSPAEPASESVITHDKQTSDDLQG